MSIILGIETSCDETAAAIVTSDKRILSNVLFSQIEEHKPYGGVVPEIASRAHAVHISDIVSRAVKESGVNFSELDAIAVTSGPGLIGGVIVGLMYAKGLAISLNKRLIAVNHLEGHALTARLTSDIQFPYLLLLVSGGHCQILRVEDVGRYKLVGRTRDDSIGEAFDKTAKLLGLGYPGGPKLELLAKNGNADKYKLPKAFAGEGHADFSLSGLKSAVRRIIEEETDKSDQFLADIAASFQSTIGDIICDRAKTAIKLNPDLKSVVIAGGVAANLYIRSRLQNVADKHNVCMVVPPVKLCTDNGVMIAWAGIEKMEISDDNDIEVLPRARWPLY